MTAFVVALACVGIGFLLAVFGVFIFLSRIERVVGPAFMVGIGAAMVSYVAPFSLTFTHEPMEGLWMVFLPTLMYWCEWFAPAILGLACILAGVDIVFACLENWDVTGGVPHRSKPTSTSTPPSPTPSPSTSTPPSPTPSPSTSAPPQKVGLQMRELVHWSIAAVLLLIGAIIALHIRVRTNPDFVRIARAVKDHKHARAQLRPFRLEIDNEDMSDTEKETWITRALAKGPKAFQTPGAQLFIEKVHQVRTVTDDRQILTYIVVLDGKIAVPPSEANPENVVETLRNRTIRIPASMTPGQTKKWADVLVFYYEDTSVDQSRNTTSAGYTGYYGGALPPAENVPGPVPNPLGRATP